MKIRPARPWQPMRRILNASEQTLRGGGFGLPRARTFGYNAATGRYGDMVAMGDGPTKVCLQNARIVMT